MFVALQRWVAVGILGGAFLAGGLGGFVLHGWQARREGPPAATAGDPRPSAPTPVAVAPAPPPIVVRVVTEAPRPALAAPARPAPAPAKAAAAKPAGAPATVERPAALGAPEVKPTPTPGHFYRVEAGDTFHEVAVRAYGGVRRLGELIRANAALDPDRIRIGSLLYVPAGAEVVPAAPGDSGRSPHAPAAPAPAPAPMPSAPAPPPAPASSTASAAPAATANPPAK